MSQRTYLTETLEWAQCLAQTLPLKGRDAFGQELATWVDRVADKVRVYLGLCPLRPLAAVTVQGLAETFGYTRDHFSKKVKADAGFLPSELIQEEKLARDLRMIKGRSDATHLKSIAQSLGFQDFPLLPGTGEGAARQSALPAVRGLRSWEAPSRGDIYEHLLENLAHLHMSVFPRRRLDSEKE